MKKKLIDTNVIIRFLVEDPDKISKKFKGVFSFFPKVERGDVTVHLPELVLLEAYYVLKSTYSIPRKEVSEKLSDLISFKGILMKDKPLMLACLDILKEKNIDLVDAYIVACSRTKGIEGVFSFDKDLKKCGLEIMEVT